MAGCHCANSDCGKTELHVPRLNRQWNRKCLFGQGDGKSRYLRNNNDNNSAHRMQSDMRTNDIKTQQQTLKKRKNKKI